MMEIPMRSEHGSGYDEDAWWQGRYACSRGYGYASIHGRADMPAPDGTTPFVLACTKHRTEPALMEILVQAHINPSMHPSMHASLVQALVHPLHACTPPCIPAVMLSPCRPCVSFSCSSHAYFPMHVQAKANIDQPLASHPHLTCLTRAIRAHVFEMAKV